ncbi:hypothetical protein AB6A40_006295 [Gnathostoma spinigerum]|uniref:Uncharacterized protein n=1 Tax=Gnathostoma spinigerum TaxID=75299 RepID=A0ABD6EQ86_9BILA
MHLLQVNIAGLRAKSWYYVCVEWENFNRHNESMGTDCRLLRTLDKFGKNADTTITDLEIVDISSTSMSFKVHTTVDFPLRITATLQGGMSALTASQTFILREASDLDVYFSFLKEDTDYGKLCLIEEPMVMAYTTMGRLISHLRVEKCYFGNLRTKDYEFSTHYAAASAYRRSASNKASLVAILNRSLFSFSAFLLYSFYY